MPNCINDKNNWHTGRLRRNSHCFPSKLDTASWVCYYDYDYEDSEPSKNNPDDKNTDRTTLSIFFHNKSRVPTCTQSIIRYS